jgi:hypothetical protein
VRPATPPRPFPGPMARPPEKGLKRPKVLTLREGNGIKNEHREGGKKKRMARPQKPPSLTSGPSVRPKKSRLDFRLFVGRDDLRPRFFFFPSL